MSTKKNFLELGLASEEGGRGERDESEDESAGERTTRVGRTPAELGVYLVQGVNCRRPEA